MTRDNYIKIIREACIRANPEIEKDTCRACIEKEDAMDRYACRPIHLADVLLAIGVHGVEGAYPPQIFAVGHPARWDLVHDDLTQQLDECLKFLSDLLKDN